MKRNWDIDELIEHWTLLPRCSDLQTEKPRTANKAMRETTLRFLSYFGDPVFEAARNPQSTFDKLAIVPNFTKS